MTEIHRRSLLGMMGAAGLGSVLANRAAGAEPPSLNIVNASSSDALVFQALMKKGDYFNSFGVNANFANMTDGAKVLAGIMSGDGDICGGGGFSGLFPAIERGAKIKIIGGAVLVPPTCLYTKRDDIHSTKDLVGKTVGTGAPGALLHELTVALLIKKGIDYKSVNFVNIGSSIDIFRAVVAGTIDAGLGSNDFYDQQEKYGVHAVSDGALWDELPEYADQAMFASDKAIAEKRDAIVRAMAATAKMFRFVTSPNSSDEWGKARAIALGKDDAEASLRQWRFFQTPGRLATNLVLSETNLEYVQKLNVLVGIQKKVLPFDQVADMSLAQDALKLL